MTGVSVEMFQSDRNPVANRLSQEETILVLEQSDFASQALAPLPPGLRAMAQETTSARVRSALNHLADRLEEGEPLADVLMTLQPGLSPLMRELILHGSEVGRMDTVLHWVAERARRRQTLRLELWGALAYPLVVASIAIAVSMFMMLYIVPDFKKIFDDFGTELPSITQALLQISDFFVNYGKWIAAIGSILVLLVTGVTAFECDWIINQGWSRFLPLVGPLFRASALADFCNLLAIFVEMRIPLSKAVRQAGEATGNTLLKTASRQLSDEVESGNFKGRMAAEVGLPVAIGQMIYDARSSDALAEALHGLAEVYAAGAMSHSRTIAVVAEPFVLVGAMLCVGMGVVALFMPLIKLLNDLS